MSNILIDFLSLEITNFTAIENTAELITSILTLVIGYALTRVAYIRWRKQLFWSLISLWFSIILMNFDTIFSGLHIGFSNYLPYEDIGTKFSLSIWLIVSCIVVRIFYHIVNLELIQFSKPNFDNEQINRINPQFNLECLDYAIGKAMQVDKAKTKKFYPIILEANEQWKPWVIAQAFAIKSITKQSTGIIYFSFARPHVNIKKDLERKIQKEIYDQNKIDLNEKELTADQKEKIQYQIEIKLNNIIIIDCFAPLTLKEKKYPSDLLKRIKKDTNDDNVFTADPRNPHLLNKKYEEALTHLINLKKCSQICVVYDSLSDFLCFTDREVAIQYLRHNMCWEENHNVSSLYILRTGTLDKYYEEYILWFANVIINFGNKNGNPVMRTCGLYDEPKCFDIDYNFKLR